VSGLRTFFAARFARRYLGLHLTIGFLVAFAALWIFADLTEDVVHAEAITRLDLSIHDWIRAHATTLGYATFGAITELGSPVVVGIFALLGATVLRRERRWFMLGAWVAAFAGGALLDALLKLLVHRTRPPFASDFLARTSFSFPSGHSMMSMVCYGMITYMLVTYRARNGASRALVIAAGILTILLVGASRLYLGVHFFSDVMAGFVAGIVWLTTCVTGLEVVRRRALLTTSSRPSTIPSRP
jgi:membrane-associated phospholipid phosphatase